MNNSVNFRNELKSITNPTSLYMDNLSMVRDIKTLANCIFLELMESSKQPKSKYLSKYLAELRKYKVFRQEAKEFIIEYLRKKGIEDSFIKDENRRRIEEIKEEIIKEIDYSNGGIIFFDMKKTEGKPKQDKFIGYMYRIDRNKNLIKKVQTIMWDTDSEGLPKSCKLKTSWGEIIYFVDTIVEKLETVVNQQGDAISGNHKIEYIDCAERYWLNKDRLKRFYEFDDDDTHFGKYRWRENPKFIGEYTVSKDNPHLISVKVCYSFDTGDECFKASEVNGEFQRTRSTMDSIPFLEDSSIIKDVISTQRIINNCKCNPILFTVSSKKRAYDFILQRFQIKINNMCKTKNDLTDNTLLETQSLGMDK